MAELVVSMAIGPLMSMLKDKVSSYLLDQYKVMEGMEEQHKILKRKLPAIIDVITDAEEQATAHREGAKAWLQELKTVAYEANEVFDEFNYEALRREAKKKGHYTDLGVHAIKLFPTHNHVMFRHRMASKLSRVLQAVEVLIAEMHAFRFKYRPQPSVSKQWRQTDYVIVDPHEIVRRSRDKDKRNIVDTLLRQANNADLTVVPIVGMGGLGKTTLAQLIYNEHEIQKHFQLLLWVCVSDTFDVNSVAKSIVEASPKKNDDTEKSPLDRLQKLLNGQRYLLVLDDVWNRETHKWDMLKMCLQHGGTGSAVLTTTRDKQVAEIMGANTTHNLNDLDDVFIKEIIEARAFTPEKEKPTELVELVGEIVKRCCGSPLAATALGFVLRAKSSVEEWKAVSCSSSICTNETGILPILKLSYNDLPSYMKQCFAFCAVFPKDYKIDVEKLIQLWIANGFIPEQNETNGRHIFNELASRSFFIDIENFNDDVEDYSRTICKIHDLMHDIAMSVMEKECVFASEKPNQTEWLSDTVRHLFLSCKETEGILNSSMEKRSPAIQTLLCDRFLRTPLQHLSKYSSLHALMLCTGGESFVLKPKYLHKLRYLDLSSSYMDALPEDISILYNLQVLDVSNCYYLAHLPRQMKYMTSLRHLYTHGCRKLESMPPELGKLTKLQTLTYFIAAVTGPDCSPDCSGVAELEHLNLGGQLELCQVENVREAEAKVANLGKKKNLKELRLRWTSVSDSKVLNNFEPHDGLQVLKIYSYGGKCMGMLQNMVEIHLFKCERLQVLFKCGTSFTFPKLKELRLEDLLDLERWWEINERQEGQIVFPVLEKLFVRHCGKLVALPEAPLLQESCGGFCSAFPALQVLELEGLESFQRWDVAESCGGEQILFPQLEELSIQNCPKLIAFPEAPLLQESCGGFHSAFPALQVLKLKDLESFQRWDVTVGGEQILFPQLEELSIQNCPKLMDLPEAPKLSVLEIEDGKQEIFHSVHRYISSLTKLILNLENTETTLEAECTVIAPMDINNKWFQKSHLTFMELGCCNSFFGSFPPEPWDYFIQLEELNIVRCHVLVHWPEKMFQSLISLKILQIRRCKNLTGYAQAPLEPSASERSQHLPGLEVLYLNNCESLVEMFNVPASLKKLDIYSCQKLESIFSKQQQGMSELVQGSSCIEVITRTAVSELSSSTRNHFCPCLEELSLDGCGNLPAVLKLPPSLKTIAISNCSSIQVLSCQLDGPPRPQVSTSINALEPSAETREHSLPPYLRSLSISSCDMLGGILRLPTSLEMLGIANNSGFISLEYLAGDPPSLKCLQFISCSALASLPNEPHAYRSMYSLSIRDCRAIKKLPRCLQQQLGSIEMKDLDAQNEVMAFNPKTWKKIPKMVSERRWYAKKRRQAKCTIEMQEA
ncbi:putative disease resistance protein RGA3 [Lolium rigidum]|uniref:putative disease resistance protein RGA3 n=1 Tax=Lolium rigidum TaxID=89674 RepID=UPI001F5C59E5|nr:putative disease resistance protein RGA3 [Lolium rigidum]